MKDNKDEPANPIVHKLIAGPGTYCQYEGETKYEIMFRSVLAGLCANAEITKSIYETSGAKAYEGVLIGMAFGFTDKSTKALKRYINNN